MLLPHNSFHFGGLHEQSWSEYTCQLQPLKWNEPSFLNWDFLGSIHSPMRSATLRV
jgi:hypothetical protein